MACILWYLQKKNVGVGVQECGMTQTFPKRKAIINYVSIFQKRVAKLTESESNKDNI